jgi:hypothetical protein
MGRTFRIIQTKDLATLFAYFHLPVEEEVVSSRRQEIADRFAAEVREIVRLCTRLREKERHQLFREALRLAYASAVRRHAAAGA